MTLQLELFRLCHQNFIVFEGVIHSPCSTITLPGAWVNNTIRNKTFEESGTE